MGSLILTGFIAQQKFKAFSLPHIIFLLTTLFLIGMLIFYKEEIKNGKVKLYLRYIIAILLFAAEASKQIADLLAGGWSLKSSLPLHLCGITSVFCIVMLVTESYGLFEVMYFWSLVGSSLAMIMPDLNVSYTSITFWAFMISHSMNIIAVIYMITAYRFRLTVNSIKKAFLYTNVYMIFIAGFNYAAGSHYYFFIYAEILRRTL